MDQLPYVLPTNPRMAKSGLSQPNAGEAGRWGDVHPKPAPETDAELVEALKRGESAAAGRIYDRHAASVQRLVYRLLPRDAELEDIVQEIFIYALDSVGKLRDPTVLKSWLLGIAAGKVRAHLRRSWRRRWLRFLPQEDLPEVPVEANDPHAELLSEVYGLLDQLPPDERVALLLRRIEGLSIHEAAAACGMSLSTFKRRLARGEARFLARAKLRPGLARWVAGDVR